MLSLVFVRELLIGVGHHADTKSAETHFAPTHMGLFFQRKFAPHLNVIPDSADTNMIPYPFHLCTPAYKACPPRHKTKLHWSKGATAGGFAGRSLERSPNAIEPIDCGWLIADRPMESI